MNASTEEPAPAGAATVVVEGVAHNGKPCRVVDVTGTIPRSELEVFLADLIAQRRFGLSGLSDAGGSTITIGGSEYGHVQFGEHLYRCILHPYEARLEAF